MAVKSIVRKTFGTVSSQAWILTATKRIWPGKPVGEIFSTIFLSEKAVGRPPFLRRSFRRRKPRQGRRRSLH